MPARSQHASRIFDGLRIIEAAYSRDHPNELVVAYFYASLHMLEATLFETHPKYCPEKHFFSHGDRSRFFKSLYLDFKNPLMDARGCRLRSATRVERTGALPVTGRNYRVYAPEIAARR